jgi:hypothetical protein
LGRNGALALRSGIQSSAGRREANPMASDQPVGFGRCYRLRQVPYIIYERARIP